MRRPSCKLLLLPPLRDAWPGGIWTSKLRKPPTIRCCWCTTFPVMEQPRKPDCVPCRCSAWLSSNSNIQAQICGEAKLHLGHVLGFFPVLTWTRTCRKTRRYGTYVQYDSGNDVRGTEPRAPGLCWPEWLSRLDRFPNGWLGRIIDLLVPQFPLSEIRYVKQPGAEQCLTVRDRSSFSLIS